MGKIINRIARAVGIRVARYRFRAKSIEFGPGLVVNGKIFLTIGKMARVSIGKNLTINSGGGDNPISRNICSQLAVEEKAILTIGDNCGFSSVCIWSHLKIEIGNNVRIGADSIILDSDAHSLVFLDRRCAHEDLNKKISLPIMIGDDVLIGARCIILKGVSIGARSIIGAGCVLTKNVPEDSIAFGNPAKIVPSKDFR
jgi:acetyltransferase-like isoleucine patch superfamily enzyme